MKKMILLAFASGMCFSACAQIIYRPSPPEYDEQNLYNLIMNRTEIGHKHSGEDITSGTLGVEFYDAYDNLVAQGRLGLGADQVAPGVHGHDLGDMTGDLGTLRYRAISNLWAFGDIGTGGVQVAAGNHAHADYEQRMTDIEGSVVTVAAAVGAEETRAILAEGDISSLLGEHIISNAWQHSALSGEIMVLQAGTTLWNTVFYKVDTATYTGEVAYIHSRIDQHGLRLNALEVSVNALQGSTSDWNTAYGWGDHGAVGYLTNVAWGEITGTLANQTDLQAALDGKASTGAVALVAADLDNHETNVNVHAIAAVNGLQSALDDKVGTNDTRTLDWTGADIRIADSSVTNNPVTRSELDVLRESLTVTDFYYNTNDHAVIAGAGRMETEIPAACTLDTGALAAGTNILYTFWLTNTTDRIRGGVLETICHVERLSGNTAAYMRFEALSSDDDGVTTNVIAAATSGENILGVVKPYHVFKGLADDIIGTNLYLGVRLSVVRAAGGSGATLRFYSGVGYPSRLATPGIGDVSGYALSSELDAVDLRVGAIESNYVVSVNSITGAVNFADGSNTTVRTDGQNVYIDATGGAGSATNWYEYEQGDYVFRVVDAGTTTNSLVVSNGFGEGTVYWTTNFTGLYTNGISTWLANGAYTGLVSGSHSLETAIGPEVAFPGQWGWYLWNTAEAVWANHGDNTNFPDGVWTEVGTPIDSTTEYAPATTTNRYGLDSNGVFRIDDRDVLDELDGNTSTANAALPKAGGTMTGDIVMAGNDITGAGTIYATNGAFSGTLTVGGNAVLTNAAGGLTEAQVKAAAPLMTNSFDVAIGKGANGAFSGVAIGNDANASTSGVAVGVAADGNSDGVAIGESAIGSDSGAAVGWAANGSVLGAAMGWGANGSLSGAAVGFNANGSNYGAAIGRGASATNNNVAIGYNVVNTVSNSTLVKGTLYAPNMYSDGWVSATQYVTRTVYPETTADAIRAIKSMQRGDGTLKPKLEVVITRKDITDAKGKVVDRKIHVNIVTNMVSNINFDHDKLDPLLKTQQSRNVGEYVITDDGMSLDMAVSCLAETVKFLLTENEALKARVDKLEGK